MIILLFYLLIQATLLISTIPIQAILSEIKTSVPMLQMNEETFVSTLLKRIHETPANYLAITEKNLKDNFSDINPLGLEAFANRCAIS